jgi:hypothetical protein
MARITESIPMTESKPSRIGRRSVFAGAGAIGALAAVAAALPKAADEAKPAKAAAAAPESGGYRLSEHVKQYYAAART